MLEVQKHNLADTTRYQEALKDTTAAQWKETADRQTQVRSLMHDLLANPIRPLGGLTAAAQKIYVNEMMLAVDSLELDPDRRRRPQSHTRDRSRGLGRKDSQAAQFRPHGNERSEDRPARFRAQRDDRVAAPLPGQRPHPDADLSRK